MDRHPIENIMTTTMENIRDMVDVNTVIGDPIQTMDGSTVIPVSRVCFGFVAGGGEYNLSASPLQEKPDPLPFAGGTGAGVTVHPMGFLVCSESQVRLLPAQPYAPIDRVIELMPQAMCEIKNALCSCMSNKQAPAQPEPPQPVPAP